MYLSSTRLTVHRVRTDDLDFRSETFLIRLGDGLFKFQGLKESISFPNG